MRREFDDMLFGSIELFCLAAKLGSFTAASVVAGVTPAAVSRSVARLEKRLQVQLFTRNTRKIRLTSSGNIYYERCSHVITIMKEANQLATNNKNSAVGTIRMSLPTTYAKYRILPLLDIYRKSNPDVNFHLEINNNNIDFFEENFDLAIRARENKDSNLIARKIEDAELVVVASPHYVKTNKNLEDLTQLLEHQCIQFSLPSNGKLVPWLFNNKGKPIKLLTRGNIFCSKEVLAGVTLAKNGAGLYQTYKFVVENDLQNGNLVEVLKPYGGRTRPFSIIYPFSKYISTKTRDFMGFLVDSIPSKNQMNYDKNY